MILKNLLITDIKKSDGNLISYSVMDLDNLKSVTIHERWEMRSSINVPIASRFIKGILADNGKSYVDKKIDAINKVCPLYFNAVYLPTNDLECLPSYCDVEDFAIIPNGEVRALNRIAEILKGRL